MTDARVYAALLTGEFALFTALAEELATTFVTDRIQYVATDAAEGYNPTHDVCHLLVTTAAAVSREDL